MRNQFITAALLFASYAVVTGIPTADAKNSEEGETNLAPESGWEAQVGDTFVANTKDNIGYLIHENGRYTSFRIASGQRRVVRYIGRTYNATTPTREWIALSSEVKGDHITFGKEGTFIRLFSDKGSERTPYGIHSHHSIRTMLSEDERFKSMGCILVSEEALSVIVETFMKNNQSLAVTTLYGEPPLEQVLTEKTSMSW